MEHRIIGKSKNGKNKNDRKKYLGWEEYNKRKMMEIWKIW